MKKLLSNIIPFIFSFIFILIMLFVYWILLYFTISIFVSSGALPTMIYGVDGKMFFTTIFFLLGIVTKN